MTTRGTAPAAGPNLSEVERSGGHAYRSEYRAGRAATFLDRLWQDRSIDYGMYRAGLELRRLIVAQWPRSEGVPSYGDGRVTNPTDKADRAGHRLTGYRLNPDGTVPLNRDGTAKRTGRGQNRRPEHLLDDALLAACGCHDQDGKKRHHKAHAELLMRIVMDSEAMPTLKGLTQELQGISGIVVFGEKSKQGPPYSLGHIHEWLGSAAVHLGFAR
jgi:hypothetical protein